jgi:iron complex transport system substrate-binding protein
MFLPAMPRSTRRQTLTLLALAALGCGREARKAGTLERIVSLSPASTEAVYALGRSLVGRSRYCDHPPQVRSVPSVGGFADPSFEAVLALGPDLVVGVRGPGLGPELEERLRARGIQTSFPPTDTLSEIEQMLLSLGERIDRAARARELVDSIAAHRGRIARALARRKRPRALLVFGLRPIVVAGSGGFPHELLTLAGADNVVTTAGARYPTLGIERVLALDPDVIVDATGVAKHDTESVEVGLPGWAELRAIKLGRLVAVRDDRVLRPGPRIAEGLEVLARALHPGLEVPA